MKNKYDDIIFTDDCLFELHKQTYTLLKNNISFIKKLPKKSFSIPKNDILPYIEHNNGIKYKDEKKNIKILTNLEKKHFVIKNWFFKIIEVDLDFLQKKIGIHSKYWICISGISNISGKHDLFCTEGINQILSSKAFNTFDNKSLFIYGSCNDEEMINTGFSKKFLSILKKGLPYNNWKSLLHKEILYCLSQYKEGFLKNENKYSNPTTEKKSCFLKQKNKKYIFVLKKKTTDNKQNQQENIDLNNKNKSINYKQNNQSQNVVPKRRKKNVFIKIRKSNRKPISKCNFWEHDYCKYRRKNQT